jgi:hypothetical protein
MSEVFVADICRTQRIWTARPELAVPPSQPGRGGPARKRQVLGGTGYGGKPGQAVRRQRLDALRPTRRHARGVASRYRHRPVWGWDGEEKTPRCWRMIVRREVKSEKTIKDTLSTRRFGMLAYANETLGMPRLIRRSCVWGRCRGSVTGSSTPSKMPRANADRWTISH